MSVPLLANRSKAFKTLVLSPRETKFAGKTIVPLPRFDTLLTILSSILSMHI